MSKFRQLMQNEVFQHAMAPVIAAALFVILAIGSPYFFYAMKQWFDYVQSWDWSNHYAKTEKEAGR